MNPDVRSPLTDHPYFYMDPQWQRVWALFAGATVHVAPRVSTSRFWGWFRTGDLCLCDRYGFYRIVGRIKDMIRRSSENISALEVERVVDEFPYTPSAKIAKHLLIAEARDLCLDSFDRIDNVWR